MRERGAILNAFFLPLRQNEIWFLLHSMMEEETKEYFRRAFLLGGVEAKRTSQFGALAFFCSFLETPVRGIPFICWKRCVVEFLRPPYRKETWFNTRYDGDNL